MMSGLHALAMIIAALPLVAAASSEASDAKRLRWECIDDCRIAATTCATRCAQIASKFPRAAAGRLHK